MRLRFVAGSLRKPLPADDGWCGARLAPLPYRVGGGAPIARVSPGFIGLGSLTTSEPVVVGGTVAVPRSGISPGVVTVPRSRLPRILLPLVSVGDGVVGLTRGAVVGLTRGTDCSSALWAKAVAVGTAAIRAAIASLRIRIVGFSFGFDLGQRDWLRRVP